LSRPSWWAKAELLAAGLGVDRLGPVDHLVVGERLDVEAGRQQVDRLFLGDHDVGGLHPGDVVDLRAAELGQLEVVRVEVAVAQLAGEVGQVQQLVVGGEAGEVAVGAADQRDVALAGLGLRGDPVGEGAHRRADEVHLAVVADEDLLAHLLGLVDRLELVGDEGQAAAAATAGLGLVGVGSAAGESDHGRAGAERERLAAGDRSVLELASSRTVHGASSYDSQGTVAGPASGAVPMHGSADPRFGVARIDPTDVDAERVVDGPAPGKYVTLREGCRLTSTTAYVSAWSGQPAALASSPSC
jgi:hypothetical protein